MHCNGDGVKLIQKWIDIVETDEMRNINEEPSEHNVDNTVREFQQSIETNKSSKTDRNTRMTKAGKTNRKNKSKSQRKNSKMSEDKIISKSKYSSKSDRTAKTPIQTRSAKYLKIDQDQDDSRSVPYNDIGRKRKQNKNSKENSTSNLQTSVEVDILQQDESCASASSANLFELGHNLYEEMVNEITPEFDSLHNAEPECSLNSTERENERQIISVAIRNEDYNNDLVNGGITENVYGLAPAQSNATTSYRDDLDLIDLTDGTPQEYAEFGQYEPLNQYPRTEYEVDDNEPIDYSIRYRYLVPTDRATDFTMTNSTRHLTESRLFISPAAPLRTGFASDNGESRDGFLSFPERFYVDEPQRTNRSDGLRFPVPQTQTCPCLLHALIPQDGHSEATNGVLEPTSDTLLNSVNAFSQTEDRSGVTVPTSETVNASSQTEVRNEDTLPRENLCKILMDNNSLNFNSLMSFLYTINEQVFNLIKPFLASNRLPPTPSEMDNRDASNQAVSLESESTFNGKRKKKVTKGIPKKQSKRLKEMALRKAVPPEKSEQTISPVSSDVEFEIENINNPSYNSSEDPWLDVVPRKVSFEANGYSLSIQTAQTPKRFSKFIRGKRLNFQ